MTDDEPQFARVTVTVEREMRVPIDIIGDMDTDPSELEERAEDWFWNHWAEMLANEPGPRKDDVDVVGVDLPSVDNS